MEKPLCMVGRGRCTSWIVRIPVPIIGKPDGIQEFLASSAAIGCFETQDIVEGDASYLDLFNLSPGVEPENDAVKIRILRLRQHHRHPACTIRRRVDPAPDMGPLLMQHA